MRRLRASVPDEYPAFDRFIDLAPEDDVALIAGEEVGPGFVIRRLMQLNAEDVTVIQDHQPPAIDFLERAGPVSPRYSDNPPDKFIFSHADSL
ncbi:Uncharacterised protein [Enterobacter hormaechei]|nr:Uncharacterised protein [Enterobacter hormaechei]SAD98494.1 Uncharacterised protein [Enterobacter hormaechei]